MRDQPPRPDEEALHSGDLLAQHSRDIVLFVRREDGRILQANAAAVRAYGYSRDELLRLTVRDLRAAETLPDVGAQMSAADERGLLFETVHRRKDGSTFPVEVSSQGAEVGGTRTLVSVVRDITERKGAQAREEALARFPQENPDPVMRLAGDLRVIYANGAARALLRDLGAEHGGPAPAPLGEAARRALREGQQVRVEITGGGAVFLFGVVPVGGEVNLYGHDITARKEAERALSEADRNKTEFLALLSHELRNPLATISNSVHLLEHAEPGSEVARRAREALRRQTGHLTRLVDDLLDVARITHGKVELQMSRLDALEVVGRTCEDLRGRYEQRGVELRWAAGAGPIWIEADAARLAQMVGNLLTNALKFTPPGGHVEVSVGHHGGACRVAVRDDGVGIDPADLGPIFTPFVQAERSRHRSGGGLGLGLALVRELARLHGGLVQASSEGHGKGAEFALLLPVAAGPPAPRAAPARPPEEARGLSVLIVEDNEDAGNTLAELLVRSGHEAVLVSGGRAGVEAASRLRPDVLICDIGLPDMSGLEVVRAVRAASGAPPPFAIALTGYAQDDDRARALVAGFDAHLAKPMSLDALQGLLNEAARRNAERAGPGAR